MRVYVCMCVCVYVCMHSTLCSNTSREATSEVAARQRRAWTAHQRQHGRGRGHIGVEHRRERKRSSIAPGRDARDSYGDQSQKAPKTEDRHTGRHASGETAEYIEDYGNHFPLRTRRPPP